jgi:ubiquinone/menaquinone biosynthesis C-methylase UbiE
MGPRAVKEPIYVCGHTPGELDRLSSQGAFFEDITRGVFQAAGLQAGWRVLDIGCGVGSVSFLAAEIVGPAGSVIGLDRAPEAIAIARARAQERGCSNVDFRLATIDGIAGDRGFDALVGRFVLMHQADPAAALHAAARHVRPGGLVIMLESAMTACVAGFHSSPHSPTYDRALRLISDIIGAAGADVGMGLRLGQVFERAGLARPTLRLHARVEGGPDAPIYRYIADSLRSVLPLAEQLAVSGGADVDIEQVEDALRAEVVASRGVLTSPPVVAAWTAA